MPRIPIKPTGWVRSLGQRKNVTSQEECNFPRNLPAPKSCSFPCLMCRTTARQNSAFCPWNDSYPWAPGEFKVYSNGAVEPKYPLGSVWEGVGWSRWCWSWQGIGSSVQTSETCCACCHRSEPHWLGITPAWQGCWQAQPAETCHVTLRNVHVQIFAPPLCPELFGVVGWSPLQQQLRSEWWVL